MPFSSSCLSSGVMLGCIGCASFGSSLRKVAVAGSGVCVWVGISPLVLLPRFVSDRFTGRWRLGEFTICGLPTVLVVVVVVRLGCAWHDSQSSASSSMSASSSCSKTSERQRR